MILYYALYELKSVIRQLISLEKFLIQEPYYPFRKREVVKSYQRKAYRCKYETHLFVTRYDLDISRSSRLLDVVVSKVDGRLSSSAADDARDRRA